MTITPIVQCGIDIMRLEESLSPLEQGANLLWEAWLVKNFLSLISGMLDTPTVILGEDGTIALWYLPGAIAQPIEVIPTVYCDMAC